jgi:hypothetical protein
VIDGVIRQGETTNIVAAPKSQKTFLAIDLAISVAMGQAWLNTFGTTQTKVLYIDFELHRETMASRLRTIASARGMTLDQLHKRLAIKSMRGKVTNLEGLRPYMEKIKGDGYGLIVLDAKYRLQAAMGGEDQANNNSAETCFYNVLDEYADLTGAAFVCVHHDAKGYQGHKSPTDRGAGAGAQSRAADFHLTLTPHEEEGCFIIEGANRSFAPLSPFVIRWNYPRFAIDNTLDASKVRKAGRPEPKEDAVEWTAIGFTEAVFTDAKEVKKEIVRARAIKAGVASARRADQLLAEAMDAGLVMEHRVNGREKRFSRFREGLTDAA